jgi:hypothetical protein
VNGLNETADVMTQNLAQQFIRLRLVSLAAERAAKLAFNHAEYSLNIRSFMVMLIKPFLVVGIEMIKASPRMVIA